jgi:hypothetical protein
MMQYEERWRVKARGLTDEQLAAEMTRQERTLADLPLGRDEALARGSATRRMVATAFYILVAEQTRRRRKEG